MRTLIPARSSARAEDTYSVLAALEEPVHVLRGDDGTFTLAGDGPGRAGRRLLTIGPLPPERLGARAFLRAHRVRQCYHAGAMANAIASVDLVAALAGRGLLASFGAAGVSADRLDTALAELSRRCGDHSFACNVIHSPSEPAMEREAVEACLRHGVRCVEASAFLGLTEEIVRYRLTGLRVDREGRTVAGHRVIAKVSRTEVAEQFLAPAPAPMVEALRGRGTITDEQARLAATVAMADDVTAESDSGGHTDGRPLTVLLGELLALRDAIALEGRAPAARVGAAGGIGTPTAVAAAFAMGADYVVTGSINQVCVEAGQSVATKTMLGSVGSSDCETAPSADMFELGATVQVMRRGSMFAARARQLYELYRRYDGIEDLPGPEREQIEKNVFRRPLSEVWDDTRRYFAERDPSQIERVEGHPKRQMALVFRWYLGLSSHWAVTGAEDRTADYQVWCGPAMGACNAWLRGSHLEPVATRTVAELAHHLLRGAAFQQRVAELRRHGIELPVSAATYRIEPLATPSA